jgi:hypothetical protein
MPADNPLIGETWETTDPATGQAAQAVVTEVNPQAVRLVARLGRLIAMPRRSFLMNWRFVLEAPAQKCAHNQCDEPAYLQVNDLGTWVWICPKHLPAHVVPLLPTDTPGAALDRCPVCGSAGSESREFGAHEINRCGACNTYWSVLMGEGSGDVESLEDGLRFGEHLQDLADQLESEGLAVRGIIGPQAWRSLHRTTNLQVNRTYEAEDGSLTRVQEETRHSFAGVQLTENIALGNALVVLGERPRTGVQRLGGQPSNDTPAPEAIPEVGSWWTNGTVHIHIDHVLRTTCGGDPRGRRLMVQGESNIGTKVEFYLSEFLQLYHLDASYEPEAESPDLPQLGSTWWETKAFRKVTIQRTLRVNGVLAVQLNSGTVLSLEAFRTSHTPEPPEPPCKVDEVWESKTSSTEQPFRIEKLLETSALVRRSKDNSQREMPYYILATRYQKSVRKSALERLTED